GIRDFHVTGVQTCALPIYIGPDQVQAFGGKAGICKISVQEAYRPGRFVAQLLPESGLGGIAFARDVQYAGRGIEPDIIQLWVARSEEHTSELQSRENLVCR